ncbi:MAG TPA: hypothetical protein PKM27_04095 [Saprospiraceae bacterium]|nr:hypothetical protein [Saprospiraceae bacterium]HNT20475.1 hypothetical protein [Saprospiraceae bacterium]
MKKTGNGKSLDLVAIILLLLLISCAEKKQKRYSDPLTPAEAMQHFKIAEGFHLELFAAEPQVMSPVDMAMDEQGILYVIEMGDYPYMPEPGSAKGLIKALQDKNKDGRVDTAIVFATKLPSATSLLPWKGGLLVAAAPDIFFMKDTTGDFVADIKEVLFTGFFDDNSEAHITSFRFCVDNWVYANNNGQTGVITAPGHPSLPAVTISGGDFRFRLDTVLFEKESGTGQFGMTMDDWGNRFYTQNTWHIQQPSIKGRYLFRHKFLPDQKADVNISDHDLEMFQLTPPPYWRLERSNRRQRNFDSLKLDRREWAEDHFTGASGGTFYGGDAYPESYYGSIFTGEVAGNLVHRDIIAPRSDKPVFSARRGPLEKDREFIASDDPWFRPVNLWLGPDGNLYLIDMYLQHIETPLSIPPDLLADMDFSAGDKYGRIYRIVSDKAPARKMPEFNLRKNSSAELVQNLAHPNQWWRLQSQKLLLERQDQSVVPLLKNMFATHTDPRARLHALYMLDGLKQLNADLVSQALKDQSWGIRKQACLLAERYPSLFDPLNSLLSDTSIQVAFQAALSIGEFPPSRSMPALIRVLEKYGSEPLFRSAVLSSLPGSSMPFLNLLFTKSQWLRTQQEDSVAFMTDFAYIIGVRRQADEVRALITLLSDTDLMNEGLQKSALAGLAMGIKSLKNKNKADPGLFSAVQNLKLGKTEKLKSAVDQFMAAIRDTL